MWWQKYQQTVCSFIIEYSALLLLSRLHATNLEWHCLQWAVDCTPALQPAVTQGRFAQLAWSKWCYSACTVIIGIYSWMLIAACKHHAAAGAVRQHSLWSTDSPTPSNVMAAAKTIAACRERILAAGQAHDHFIWDDIHHWTAKKWAVLLKNRSPRTIIMKSLWWDQPRPAWCVGGQVDVCMHTH